MLIKCIPSEGVDNIFACEHKNFACIFLEICIKKKKMLPSVVPFLNESGMYSKSSSHKFQDNYIVISYYLYERNTIFVHINSLRFRIIGQSAASSLCF